MSDLGSSQRHGPCQHASRYSSFHRSPPVFGFMKTIKRDNAHPHSHFIFTLSYFCLPLADLFKPVRPAIVGRAFTHLLDHDPGAVQKAQTALGVRDPAFAETSVKESLRAMHSLSSRRASRSISQSPHWTILGANRQTMGFSEAKKEHRRDWKYLY